MASEWRTRVEAPDNQYAPNMERSPRWDHGQPTFAARTDNRTAKDAPTERVGASTWVSKLESTTAGLWTRESVAHFTAGFAPALTVFVSVPPFSETALMTTEAGVGPLALTIHSTFFTGDADCGVLPGR